LPSITPAKSRSLSDIVSHLFFGLRAVYPKVLGDAKICDLSRYSRVTHPVDRLISICIFQVGDLIQIDGTYIKRQAPRSPAVSVDYEKQLLFFEFIIDIWALAFKWILFIIRVVMKLNASIGTSIELDNIIGNCDVTFTACVPSSIMDFYHNIFSTFFKNKIGVIP
jgi:hypothetical protein